MKSALQNLESQSSSMVMLANLFRQPVREELLRTNPPTAADQAYHRLREGILNLEFPPGSILRDTELMSQLDLGRTPIREAIKRLEIEQLVVSQHRKGTFVRKIMLQDIKDHYPIHRQLISLAAALAAQAKDKSLIHDLKRYHSRRILLDEPIEILIGGEIQFQLKIAEAVRNHFLSRSLQLYLGYARRTYMFLAKNLSPGDLYWNEYPLILTRILEEKGEAASLLMAEHVDKVHLQVVDSYLNSYIAG